MAGHITGLWGELLKLLFMFDYYCCGLFAGNFSFGSVARFRSQTMVEFIDKAIEHSRSGRFLFFLHRRPTHGPTRVQLLHPVSRFRQVQSLQHICRYALAIPFLVQIR